jgi:hypothetical protein
MIKENSRVTNYEVIDKDGIAHGPFHNIIQASAYAQEKWPDQEQDEERSGNGWDIQIIGCDKP